MRTLRLLWAFIIAMCITLAVVELPEVAHAQGPPMRGRKMKKRMRKVLKKERRKHRKEMKTKIKSMPPNERKAFIENTQMKKTKRHKNHFAKLRASRKAKFAQMTPEQKAKQRARRKADKDKGAHKTRAWLKRKELRKHIRHMARIDRFEEIAKTKNKPKLLAKAQILRKKEMNRHATRFKKISTKELKSGADKTLEARKAANKK